MHKEKNWRTTVGNSAWCHKRDLMIGAKDLLKRWGEEVTRKDVCVVCGDGIPKTILQIHHLNPDNSSEGKVQLCASCHNIFNKARKTTNINEVIRDLNIRHNNFNYNLKRHDSFSKLS
jgi:hypothetical protein